MLVPLPIALPHNFAALMLVAALPAMMGFIALLALSAGCWTRA
jgi:hypothetical protein